MKKLFYLVAGYLAGTTISSMYSDKKNLSKENNKLKVLVDNFVEMHKKLFDDIKEKSEGFDFEDKKEEVMSMIENYKKESEQKIKELKTKGKDYYGKASKELETFYKEKKVEGEKLLKSMNIDKESIDEYKTKLQSVYKDLKGKLSKK